MPPKRKGRKGAKEKVVRDPKKEMLLREMNYGSLNTERYRRLWRDTLMRIKLPEIRKSVEIAWQSIERTFDLKDYRISLLLDGLQEVEEQRRRANGARVETFDRSIQVHEVRLKTIDATFRETIEKTTIQKKREFESIERSRNDTENVLRRIMWRVSNRDDNASSIAKSIAIGKINTFSADGENDRRVTTALLEKRLEDLCTDLRNVFAEYRRSTADRRKAYDAIRKKDESDRREIVVQWKRIANLLTDTAKFRENIRTYRDDASTELREIIRESDFFHDIYRRRNEYFVLGTKRFICKPTSCVINNLTGRENDKRKAITMSKEYDCTVKRFKKLIDKAERVLAYVQICRKYETEDEQILPANNNGASFEAQQSISQITSSPLQLAVEDYENSVNFWRRVGLAQLIVNELRIERDRLSKETDNLRKSVASYFYALKPTPP
ncbi:dynein regulatory complex subunit 2 isoform X1 [Megachile rotundata]|uniref:dynein regulatory complex subunit 2 isoform X1 n=1 Tax=Megachile rotundata TaxID=143995 RepID=UPI003FD3CD0E